MSKNDFNSVSVVQLNVFAFLNHIIFQVVKSASTQGHDNTDKYRQLLVQTMHACTVKFPDTAATVIPVVSKVSNLCSSFET